MFALLKKVRKLGILLALVLGAGDLTADTYNFIFPSKKERKEKRERENQAPVPSEKDPVILNNNIQSTATTPAVVTPSPTDDQKMPSLSSEVMSTAAALPSLSRFRFGVTGMMRNDWGVQTVHKQSYGGALSLHTDLFPLLSANLYGGLKSGSVRDIPFVLGLEAEVQPFRRSIQSWHAFELGFMAGVSLSSETVRYSYNSYSSSGATNYSYDYGRERFDLYLGSRVVLNLNESTGLTGTVRANSHFVMYEVGMMTRL